MRSSYDLKKEKKARDPVTLPLLFVSEGYVTIGEQKGFLGEIMMPLCT